MNYAYNGRGEQVGRYPTAVANGNMYTLYDEAGHWIGDYDSNGTVFQQAIWLDDLPVGLLISPVATDRVRYIEPDHLGTPRVVIHPTRNVAVWTWNIKSEPFGNTVPNPDPDADGGMFVLNMRFPGQRYDSASGLNQNYFRDYDPATGRYPQSDPIGLAGGVKTYGYASGNPLVFYDPFGLKEGSATNIAKRQALSNWALNQDGSTAYSKSADYSEQYPADSWKCAAFTCAGSKAVDAPLSVKVPNGKGKKLERCPTAAELANGNISGWRKLGKNESPEIGDIASIMRGGDGYTGHTAILVPAENGGNTSMGAHGDRVGPAGADDFGGQIPSFLRYTGD